MSIIEIAIIDGPLKPRSDNLAEIARHTFSMAVLKPFAVDAGGFFRSRVTMDIWYKHRKIFERSGFHLTWPSTDELPGRDLLKDLGFIKKKDGELTEKEIKE